MLTKIRALTAPSGTELDLSLQGSEVYSSPLQLRNVEGLEPVSSSINTVQFAQNRGQAYSGSTVGKRNIVLTIGLNPNWDDQSVASLRALLYVYFMPEQKVLLHIFSDHLPTVGILGYVESFQTNIFSKDPEIQISIICPQPDFVDLELTSVSGVVNVGTFFDLDLDDRTEIEYVGSLSTGIHVSITAGDTFSETSGTMSIYNIKEDLGLTQLMSFEAEMASSYNVQFSSASGDKYINNLTDEGTNSILKTVTPESDWPILLPGTNFFGVMSEIEEDLVWTLEYYNRFGGV